MVLSAGLWQRHQDLQRPHAAQALLLLSSKLATERLNKYAASPVTDAPAG